MKTFEVKEKWSNQTYTVSIEPNEAIYIECRYENRKEPKDTFIIFNIGDTAEYDSYNLSYLGTIVGITDKTVTIDPGFNSKHRRLKLNEFCSRNWDFNLELTNKRNFETMQTI